VAHSSSESKTSSGNSGHDSSSGSSSSSKTANNSSKKSNSSSDTSHGANNSNSSAGSNKSTHSASDGSSTKNSGGSSSTVSNTSSGKDSGGNSKSSNKNSSSTTTASNSQSSKGDSNKSSNKTDGGVRKPNKNGQNGGLASSSTSSSSSKSGKDTSGTHKSNNDSGHVKTASHTEPSDKNSKHNSSSDASKSAGGTSSHNGGSGSKKTTQSGNSALGKKSKPIQTANNKSVKDAREKLLKNLDSNSRSHISDKIKDNKKLSKLSLKPDSDDKNGNHLHKKDALLPKNAKTFGPTTTEQAKIAKALSKNNDPKIAKLGKDILAGKPLTNSERKELRVLSQNKNAKPGEVAAANQILKQDKQEKILDHIAAGVGLLGAGIAAGEIFHHHDHFVPGIPQLVGGGFFDLPPACDCGPTLFCPCAPCDFDNGGAMPDSCGYCMSTTCDVPPDYTDPGQYIEVPQGPPAYGEAPVDDGGALAQSGDSGDNSAAETPADSSAADTLAEGDTPAGDPGVTVESASDDLGEDVVSVTAVPHHTRYLRVANITGGELKVYLQYYTEDENGDWDWSPATPEQDSDAFAVDLDPNEATDIMDGDWRVNASKVRIWAKSDGGKEWNKFKTVDLDLVPEKDAAGTPTYLADNEETFCFTVK
jgi:hypothetical protein